MICQITDYIVPLEVGKENWVMVGDGRAQVIKSKI